jgi:hypothetical protein
MVKSAKSLGFSCSMRRMNWMSSKLRMGSTPIDRKQNGIGFYLFDLANNI